MKKKLLFKKLIFNIFFLIIGNVLGQNTYSGFPTTVAAAADTSGNQNFGCGTYYGGTIKAYISSISSNQISVTSFKQDGSSFSSGTFKIFETGSCSTYLVTGTITSGTTKTLSFNVSHTGNKYYRVIFISNTSGLTYYSNEIRILGTAPQPPILKVVSCFTTNASSFNQGGYLSGSIDIRNTPSTQNWDGYISVFLYSPTTGQTYSILSGTYYSIPGLTSQTINFGASLNFPIGTYKLYCQYTNAPNGGTDYIDDSNNLCVNDVTSTGTITPTKLITINAPVGCITWSGTAPTGDKLTAANYLCSAGIIQNAQNGTENATQAITRELMAKITYLGLYKDVPVSQRLSPAQYFPVPFNDMQNSTSEWITAVKMLAYLQWNDDKTPFDRDFINFSPNTELQRKYALKVLLEAFDIPLSLNSVSPYSDISNTDPEFKYIRTAYELGLLPSGTIFNSNGSVHITREDVFVALWKILSNSSITKPAYSQLNSQANYFVPLNKRYATFNKIPGIDQANFNHYQKTSFSIAGRGIPLDFTHTYNSFLTELPKGYFEDGTSGQSFSPLGMGWTHTYNIYAQRLTDGVSTTPSKILVFYPDGSINAFDYTTGQAEGIGIYDMMTKTSIAGGERITITTKNQVKYILESYNNGDFYFIKSIKDRNNNGVKCIWEASSTVPSVAKYHLKTVQEEFNNGSLGRSLTFGYASIISPFIQSITESGLGRTVYFNVDIGTKNLLWYKDPKGQQTNYTYDDSNHYNKSNLLTEIQLPKGNKIQNTYENRKLKSSKTIAQSGVATSTTNINWIPNYSSSGYNSSATITEPPTSVSPTGRITTYTHNTLGNPTQIVAPTGTVSFNSFDVGNNQNLPTNLTVNGISSSISYDSKGNILNISKNGITNSFTYTALNDIDTYTDGRGLVTNYDYDADGNLQYIIRPSGGGTTTISRNSFGQIQSVTNPSNITTSFGFDGNGLVNQTTIPGNINSYATYDNASRLVGTKDANGFYQTFQYDPNDNLKDSWDDYGNNTHHTYDANDNHETIKNSKNETQTNTYNFDDDTLASESFGSHTKSYTYNEDGSLATHTRGNGTFTYTYYPNGRLKSDGQTSYEYDTRGNIEKVTNSIGDIYFHYDNNDRIDYYDDYFGNRVKYTYDNNNNVTQIAYDAAGTKTVTYTYDNNNRCTKVKDWNGKETIFEYFTDDRLYQTILPNGTSRQITYDSAGRPVSLKNKKSNSIVINAYEFTLDNMGNHLTETITEPSILLGLQSMNAQNVSYGSYPYNRIQSQGSTNFTHNTAGAITQAGNDAYTYDLNDNLLTASNSTFMYDGAGNRRGKTVNGVATRYVLDILGMSQVLMETNSSNAVQNYYVYGPTGLLYRIKADNTYSYYHYDYRGSTTAITNDAQQITHSYSYDPFGKVLAKTEADANPFQYVGQQGVQYESPTLTFMRARYYNPTIGRFVSEDPIWALNLYPYVDNNPIMGIDPEGEATKRPDVALRNMLGSKYFDAASNLVDIGIFIEDNNEKILSAFNGNDKTKKAVIINLFANWLSDKLKDKMYDNGIDFITKKIPYLMIVKPILKYGPVKSFLNIQIQNFGDKLGNGLYNFWDWSFDKTGFKNYLIKNKTNIRAFWGL